MGGNATTTRHHRLPTTLAQWLARLSLILCVALLSTACTYLKYTFEQAKYSRKQKAEPGQLNVKHMLDRESWVVIGNSVDTSARYRGIPKVIAAYSSKYRPNERVDRMFFEVAGSHFGLNLPEGSYDLIVFADINSNGNFESSEAVGRQSIVLNANTAPDKVLGNVDVSLTAAFTIDWNDSITAPASGARSESLFYPSGTIRGLHDPIFDRSFATLGMYDPAAFLEQAPTMFYALEEDLAYKIPVVLVHGIDGSAREFSRFVDRMDRNLYKPWFYHYPSGGDLDQLAEVFYRIFLSGELYRSDGMPMIIIAHSMGGLIAREAINKYAGETGENQVHLFVSMATPFGGHAAAASGEKHGLIVLPSWRDLNPDNAFIGNLFRKPLPEFTQHELIYAYHNPSTIKTGKNSDGVVTLESQLQPQAQHQASGQFGFEDTHTGVLDSDAVAAYILTKMAKVDNKFPASHLRLLQMGGYNVKLGETYSPLAKYTIQAYGKYLMALASGTLNPIHLEQEHFIAMANGKAKPNNDVETGWLRFIREHPEFSDE